MWLFEQLVGLAVFLIVFVTFVAAVGLALLFIAGA